MMKDKIFCWMRAWDSFWFKPMDVISMGCFRFCFCFVLLAMYSVRFFDIRLFFYDSGLISNFSVQLMNKISGTSVHWLLSSDLLLYWCYLAFLLILFLMILGVGNRLLTAVAFVLHLIFLHRNPSIVFEADVVASFWLFYLIFSNSYGEIKWVKYFLNKRKGLVSDRVEKGNWLNTIAFRFIQIQLAVMYAFSGFQKLQEFSWWEGTALWGALTNHNFAFFDFSFLLSLPVLSVFFVTSMILFEIYFPVLIWTPQLKKTLLIAGLFFHFVIGFGLGLYFLSLSMLCAYVLFISPETLRLFFRRFQK